MEPRVIIDSTEFNLILKRLAYQLIENHGDFSNSAIIGLQTKGVVLADRLKKELDKILPNANILCGALDITFFRDDFRRGSKPLVANTTKIDFIIENKNIILIDDVFFTGRTVRAGLDAMLAFGRPASVELLVFVNRRYKRHLPVQPTYIGKTVDSVDSEKVKVEWSDEEGKDQVVLYKTEN